MSPQEFQELGRRYYKLKEYEKAVDAFTHGIDITPSISLFDYRAAAYDRLKDYNSAVKDGREMIKLDKQDVKGYLRTASVLEKMEKWGTALGIYKYGMKNILQQLHDKMTRKLSPAKSVDPLTVLPVELAEMVLEYLSFRQIVNNMRVSKGWRDYLSKLPRLWLHLDLSGARKNVTRGFIDKAVRRSEYRLTRVTIHRFEHVDVLKNVAKACKNLAELEFISLPHTMSSMLLDIVKCFRFPILPSTLKTLIIEHDGAFLLGDVDSDQLLRSCLPALMHLRLADIGISAELLHDFLDAYVDEDDHGQLKALVDAAPLQSLSLHGIMQFAQPGLFNPSTSSLFTTSPRILTPSLQSLDMAGISCTDDEIEHLVAHKTGLTSINVSSTQITGASIKMLADKLPSLKNIRADNCHRINGRDAIEYARRKGISISCSMDEGKGSRKIRYG
ncbi:hypothetical protein EK21DRAFT_98580 [Setomelanomma holmii]|uniref:F-box domain-containing protein n=1 Tax=Setomelanomma holmii TaxID=210430 RepID=A0A9P4LPC3_9PLEO|nr:hypothetical protein EK21DRAFT_98580 [Setomelanomma holmii]